jgi:cell division protein FtsI (penicillin-binding protein 3)
MRKAKAKVFAGRRYLLLFAVFCVFVLLFARAAQLQLLHADFYNEEGSNRHIRTVEIPANRGVITDRHGEALAISTPVYSIWAHPKTALENPQSITDAAKVLGINKNALTKKLKQRKDKQFVYVKRHVFPNVADELKQKNVTGLSSIREYRRYYPTREMAAHGVGLTNLDAQGLEGVE